MVLNYTYFERNYCKLWQNIGQIHWQNNCLHYICKR